MAQKSSEIFEVSSIQEVGIHHGVVESKRYEEIPEGSKFG